MTCMESDERGWGERHRLVSLKFWAGQPQTRLCGAPVLTFSQAAHSPRGTFMESILLIMWLHGYLFARWGSGQWEEQTSQTYLEGRNTHTMHRPLLFSGFLP